MDGDPDGLAAAAAPRVMRAILPGRVVGPRLGLTATPPDDREGRERHGSNMTGPA
ncbi:hypothetical protein AAFN86_07115 [Roseomonas sp. CAU 1739]|uniref:hypothetical protein n=1 Tax=Roseomonas sp. CAU 1739 TaxID=3140364 RepID=UPI00325B3828